MPKVPDWMRDNFRRGLVFHEEGKSGDGLVPRTVAEARRAVNQGDLPDTKPVRMAAWFARHMGDLDTAPERGSKDFPSPGQVAHLLWGGGVTKSMSLRAQRWAEREVARQQRESSATIVAMADEVVVDPDAVDSEDVEEVTDEEETVDTSVLPSRAVIVVATEGEETADGRIADEGSLSWRTPPLSLTVNHDPNQRAGRIDVLRRVSSLDGVTVDSFGAGDKSDEEKEDYGSGPMIVGLVTFNLDTPFGREVAAEVRDGFLTGVSMEVGDEVIEYDDNDVMHLVEGKIGAVTLAPFQAIESARVVQVASAFVWKTASSRLAEEALVAAAAPVSPPANWFVNPCLDGPSGLTVDDDGFVFGHLALWNTCHTGREDVCVTAPSSQADYSYFCTGYVKCLEGETVAVGSITMATGHASTRPGVTAASAVAHYEHTGFAVADVVAGEDEFGVWVSGALRPGVTAEQVRELRGASLSGDWRNIGGNLELVAALAVNVPGFPVPRVQAGLAASGQQTALVAAGAVGETDCGCDDSDSYGNLADRITKLEAVADILGLAEQATNKLSARITN